MAGEWSAVAQNSEALTGQSVTWVAEMPAANHPELVYWFWQSNTLAHAQYLQDVQQLAGDSPFTLAFLTERGVDFYDYALMHDVFAQTVRAAHARHLKIGLQLWDFWSLMRQDDATRKARPPLSPDQSLALITEGEVTLNSAGHADYHVTSTEARDRRPYQSEVLKVYAFRKTAAGGYEENSLHDITASARTIQADPASVTLAIDAPATLAGDTAYVLAVHYFDYPDLFNDVMADTFRDALRHYADIPFDGTALDEFGYLMIRPWRSDPFRGRFYGRAFAGEFARRYGVSLEQTLLDMRYAPAGKPEVRAGAINHYFDVLRDGPLRVEQAFYTMSREIFGPDTFAGIHDTYHNSMGSDDLWRVGFNWWSVPRAYGQSDEDWPLPERMGLLVAHSQPVMFDQYYNPDLNRFLKKAFRDARYGGRIHYHAWNDTGKWGLNLADATNLTVIRGVEDKIRLLNQFNPAAPKLPVLMVFGMPALINWFPEAAARSLWDINGKLGIEQKAQAVWNAGYPCALLPSDLIDHGQITLDPENHPVINGHRFDALIYLYPQYAKATTLNFLEQFTRQGGRLMLAGTATSDFDGHDIRQRFQAIAARATVDQFDVAAVARLGVSTNALAHGALMEDGSVVFADFDSWWTRQPQAFAVKLSGHDFSGSYTGVCALQAGPDGLLEKMACGGFSELRRDGKVILSLAQPADALIVRTAAGNYAATLTASSATNHGFRK